MDLGLKGRRALVTAASKGIGRACAEALIAESSSVFIASRDPKAIQAAAEKIGAAGFSARDLSHPGDPEALVGEAIDRLGGLDLLVVNTGGPPPGLFESISLAGWDEAYQVVLMSAVRLVKAAVPHLRHSEAGRIVFITSVSVRQPIQRLVLSGKERATTPPAKPPSSAAAKPTPLRMAASSTRENPIFNAKVVFMATAIASASLNSTTNKRMATAASRERKSFKLAIATLTRRCQALS